MAHPALAKILILHDRDQRYTQVATQLNQWPIDRENTERDIADEMARVVEAEDALKLLEVKRKELEGEVADTEEHIRRYRTQQLSVKKQDEYNALENEITTLKETIDDRETEELDILDAIDHSQNHLARIREDVATRVAALEGHLRTIDEGMTQNKNALGDAKIALDAARAELSAHQDALREYDFVRAQVKRFPIVVELVDGKCKGCHLKVSSEVESSTRKGSGLVRCSSCGRIIYSD